MLEISLPRRIAVPSDFDLTTFFRLMDEAKEIDECYSSRLVVGNDAYIGESTFFTTKETPLVVKQLTIPIYDTKAEAEAAKNEIVRRELAARELLAFPAAPTTPAADDVV
jgi:hypothetical protein